jgi:ribosomal protein RSM22 (predicted rRNA methylase)
MELPIILRQSIEELASQYDTRVLTECVRALTHRYTEESGAGRRLLTADAEAAAYCAVRMPATFGAVSAALQWADACCDIRPRTLLDVGAGTGAGSWAVNEVYALEKITCLEREAAMRKAGSTLMQRGDDVLRAADWQDFDLTENRPLPAADMVIESYVLNEMTEDMRLRVAEKLWDAAGTMLLLVEPGTPVASAQLQRIRAHLLARGAHIAAPCPTENACPIADGDWCHFQCRVARSRLHKQLKGGDVPYEDEKFSYLALVRKPAAPAAARILRTPYTEKARITLTLCDGQSVGPHIITKKSGGFKSARKAECGDSWNEE